MGYSPEELFACSLKVDNIDIPLSSNSFNISFSDSIYRLCPELILSGNDISGIASESRLGIIGQKATFDISAFGIKTKLPMVCKIYETPSSNSMNGLSGFIRFTFQHIAKYTDRKNAVWDNKSPSNVFSDVVSDVDHKNLTDCATLPLIYNPGYDAEELTDKILLKLSSNGKPSSPPYYAFIDIQNDAWYTNLTTMYSKKTSKKIIFGQPINNDQDCIAALKLNSFSQDYSKISPYIDETLTYFTDKNEMGSQDLSLKNMFNPLALMKNTSGSNSRATEEYLTTIDPNAEYARLNMERRKGLLFDKLVIVTLMDPSLHAGLTVNVDAYLDVPGTNKAESFSGKFLVEASEHTWDCSNLMGYTKLILGRPTMEISGKELY